MVYPNGVQGWSVWRRGGVPALVSARGRSVIPGQFNYGPVEACMNPTHLRVASERFVVNGEINSKFSRVWWDKP